MKNTPKITFQKLSKDDRYYYVHTPEKSDKKVLVVSGLHGDEGGVIEPLFHVLQYNIDPTTTIVFIPTMCPSALKKRQRNNERGENANRIFYTNKHDPENGIVTEIVMEYAPYDLVISFHEDLGYPQVYVYEMGKQTLATQLVLWKTAIQKTGLHLLNGVDDPQDVELQYIFHEGYNYTAKPQENGQFEDWVVSKKIAQQSLTIEVPSVATKIQKEEVIRASLKILGEI